MNEVELRINGELRQLLVPGSEVLLETLGERLGITSVRGTCGIGICGTCTVLVDGDVLSGCLTLTASLHGATVVTSEGLINRGELSRVQQAFVDAGAFQCSFCIPGFVLAVHARLAQEPAPSRDDLRQYLAGNLCRCGTYPEILNAIDTLLSSGSPSERLPLRSPPHR